MKILITKPCGSRLGGLESQLQKRWRLAANDACADIEFIEADKNEIHGQLLERLWVTRVRPALEDYDNVLISEIDMVPTRGLGKMLDRFSLEGFDLVAAPYVTRHYEPGEEPARSAGKLLFHQHENLFLAGPWYLQFGMPPTTAERLDDDWLGASGKFNDAANLAPHRLRAQKPEASIRFIETHDAWPMIHGTRHPKCGTHGFFARALDLPDEQVICWPEQPNSLTAGEHRRNFGHLLLPS